MKRRGPSDIYLGVRRAILLLLFSCGIAVAKTGYVTYRGAMITLPPRDDWHAKADDTEPSLFAFTSGATAWVYELDALPPRTVAAMTAIAARSDFHDTKVTKIWPLAQHGKRGYVFSGTAALHRTPSGRGGATFTLEGVVLAGYGGKRAFAAVAFVLDGMSPDRQAEARQVLASLR